MLFSSPRFFCFLAVMLLLLALPLRNAVKLRILAAGSCFFYAAWDYRYLALLLAISAIDYFTAARISATEHPGTRRAYLLLSIVSNLGILAYFKYANFFIDNVNALRSSSDLLPHLHVLLPAGISFYTFKTMSYTIDVYRRRLEPVRSLIDYTTFVTFFPELIAGPIVRASVFLPQMSRNVGPTRDRLALGSSIFLLGLTKKLLLADRLSSIADPVFADPSLYSPAVVWMGVLAYTLQIYCDFSGYSDMAIGTAKMIGYDLPRNFDMPYLSGDITEFWRRWHITLSEWLRDYLYIPLGGNRHGTWKTYRNLMLTMLLGGLWHGASWNFVVWGALHGIALAVHRVYARRMKMPRVLGTACTFLFVMLCWIPFRAPTFASTMVIFRRMFTPNLPGVFWLPTPLLWCVAIFVAGHALGLYLSRAAGAPRLLGVFGATLVVDPVSGWHVRLGVQRIAGSYLVCTWLLALYFFAATSASPFIYFQF